MNWKIFFLIIDKLSELQRPESSLLFSEIKEGKKENFEQTMFYIEMGMLCSFLEVWDKRLTVIEWKRYWGCSFLTTLTNF